MLGKTPIDSAVDVDAPRGGVDMVDGQRCSVYRYDIRDSIFQVR